MADASYNKSTTLTAFPPEMARRQLLKISVFVDGNNWYHRLKELLNNSTDSSFQAIKPPPQFLLRPFCTELTSPDSLVSIKYYKGIVKQMPNDPRSAKMYADEQRAFKFLKDNQGVELSFGKIIRHPDGSFHEKGVDLRLAIDMIKDARENLYDVAYLMSSDNDLRPAIEECQALGKKVVYVGSSLKPSIGLQTICDRTILVQQKDVLPFMPPQQSLL